MTAYGPRYQERLARIKSTKPSTWAAHLAASRRAEVAYAALNDQIAWDNRYHRRSRLDETP